MKIKILIILLFVGQFCKANMSSPIIRGTMASFAFTSKDIDILSEIIQIKIDKDFKTARFIVEYTVQSDVTGRQIPLLFYAQDYKGSFSVWVDNREVTIQNIPEDYIHIDNSPFSMFAGFSKEYSQNRKPEEVLIYWDEKSGYSCGLTELKYFEADFVKGTHKIKVEYTANVWMDASGWVNEYSFRYSLAPAKFWKSFGTLNISIEQEGAVRQLSTNIGQPIEKTFQNTSNWTFTRLPDEYLKLSYSPKISNLAKALITIEPLGLSIIAAIILFVLHLFFVRNYRRRFASKKYSPVVILGSLIIPFLILLSYFFSYIIIDNAIGEEAGRHHGYVILVVTLYPILLPIYWTILGLLDRHQKRKMATV